MKPREYIGVLITLLVLVMSGCATPKNTDHTTQIDYSNNFKQMQSRMDSLLLNMKVQRKEMSEKLSNLKIENRTVNLSPPDSTGKQYPTQVSDTSINKEDKETNTTETNIEVTMQKLVKEVSDLKQQLDAAILDKAKIVEVSWWDLHKTDVYVVLLIVGWCLYKKFKK